MSRQGEKMNTCLAGLWDILMEPIYEMKHIYTITENVRLDSELIDKYKAELCDKIEKFYESDPVTEFQHVEKFKEQLMMSNNSLLDAAKEALNYADNCHMCVACIGCARKFYEEILDLSKNIRPLPLELSDYFSENSQFYYYLSTYRNVKEYRKINNTLICLKGFSSTTPTIYSATFKNACTGGGIYLNIGGYGIVIDPGIGFVDSMHKQGIFIEDINAVIITHNHLDHNADLNTISALQYDLNSYYSKTVLFYNSFFHRVTCKNHQIAWLLDESTKNNVGKNIGECNLLSEYIKEKELNNKVKLSVIKTQHIKNESSTYGIKLKIENEEKDIVIGYTSDTKYFEKLSEYYNDVDILIFNISDIYEKDVQGKKSKNSHLGYDGSVNLLKNTKCSPRLAIASEFCCSNGDYRTRVARKIVEQVAKQRNTNLLPGEIGLKVDLDNLEIYCTHCKCAVPAKMISVVTPEREFGEIQYICNKCQYT